MKDTIANITKWILYILLALVLVSGILFMFTDALSVDAMLNWAKLLLILGVAVMVISPIYGFIINPKNAVKMLIMLGIFTVIIIIAYSMSTVSFTDLQLETLKTTANTSRIVGTGLYVTYIAMGLAVLAAIYASFVKVFK
jgi:hypothetical protein